LNDISVRPVLLVAAIFSMALVPVAGCQPTNMFHGRIILINSTGLTLRSPSLRYVGNSPPLNIEFPDLAIRQAGVWGKGPDDSFPIIDSLELSWVAPSGAVERRTIPFFGEVPEPCYEDYFIEVGQQARVRCGLLSYRNYREEFSRGIITPLLAGAAGLALGWLLCYRDRQTRPSQSKTDGNPEL
jgi:hypothetical protein